MTLLNCGTFLAYYADVNVKANTHMLTRRSFFRKLSGAVAGALLACNVKLPSSSALADDSHVEPEIILTHHAFESRVFQFMPSFQDFLAGHFKHSTIEHHENNSNNGVTKSPMPGLIR